jgi:hypothetical protein
VLCEDAGCRDGLEHHFHAWLRSAPDRIRARIGLVLAEYEPGSYIARIKSSERSAGVRQATPIPLPLTVAASQSHVNNVSRDHS